MKRTPAGSWAVYAILGLVVTVAVAGCASLFVGHDSRAIWTAAALAYVLQLIAFGILLALREQAQLFLAGWLGGMLLRFGGLGLFAYWVSSSHALPRDTALLSFVGFLFLLMLLEPVMLRWDTRG